MRYQDIYRASLEDPEAFWMQAADAIDWERKPSRALFDREEHIYEWYADGLVNGCYNAVDRHVAAGRGAQAAIIYDSPITGTKSTLSYADLQTKVASLAGAMVAQGVGKGDRVIIYMPMIPEALEAMLGLRAHRCGAFCRLWRVCCERTGRAH